MIRTHRMTATLLGLLMILAQACGQVPAGGSETGPELQATAAPTGLGPTAAPLIEENNGPPDFSATLTAPDVVLFQWQPVADAVGYELQLDLGSDPEEFVTLAELPAESTSFEDLMAPPDSEVTYRLQTLMPSGPEGATRLRVKTEAPAPSPLTVAPTYDDDASLAATIGVAGGTITMTDAQGVDYRLDIPAGRLEEDTELRMTPVTSIEGWPLDGKSFGAVLIGPEGLRLNDAATLTITFPGQADPSLAIVGYAFDGGGHEFHLRPVYPDRSAVSAYPGGAHRSMLAQERQASIVTTLIELTTYGVGQVSSRLAGELVKTASPTDAGSASAQKEAAAQAESDLEPLGTIKPSSDPVRREADAIFGEMIRARSCDGLKVAIERAQQWSLAQQNGNLSTGEVQLREGKMTGELIDNLIGQVDRASDDCVEGEMGQSVTDVPCLTGILRSMAAGATDFWANAGAGMKKKYGVDDLVNSADELDKCRPSYKALQIQGGATWKSDCIEDLTKSYSLFWETSQGFGSFLVSPTSSQQGRIFVQEHAEVGGYVVDYAGGGRYRIEVKRNDSAGHPLELDIVYTTSGTVTQCVGEICAPPAALEGDEAAIPIRVQPGLCPKP